MGALARDGAGREGHFVFNQNARGREASLGEIQKIEKRREGQQKPQLDLQVARILEGKPECTAQHPPNGEVTGLMLPSLSLPGCEMG